MQRLLFLAVLVLGLFARADVAPFLAPNHKTAAAAAWSVNQFAFEYLAKKPAGNVFFSPYSIETVMAMADVGARRDTDYQMNKVLHLSNYSNAEFQKLQDELKGTKDYQLYVANRLWGSKGAEYLAPFLETLKTDYNSDLKPMDFKTQSEAARAEINTWVEKGTNEKIKSLLPPGILTPNTELVLTNAIYFKGTWAKNFEKSATHRGDFKSSKRTDKVSFMHAQEPFLYLENGSEQVLEMPYLGDDIAMDIILPNAKTSLAKLEKALGVAQFAATIKKLTVWQTIVELPKFKAETTADLSKDLIAMGMPDAFDPKKADFGGIRKLESGENLFISAVLHKAFVDVDEAGTEAAAATAVVMMREGAVMFKQKPKEFRANRPFLYLIRHKKSGAILFIGRYDTPESGQND